MAKKKQFEKPLKDKKGVLKTRSGLMTVDKTIQFMDAFYRNGGNATEAALDVFECSTRASAAQVGRQYLDKAQKRGLVASFMENNGIGYNDLIQHAYKMMQNSKNPGWWDRMMKEAGYAKSSDDSKKVGPSKVEVNVFKAHRSISDDYIQEAEVIDD
jgi:hypothetical protein